MMSLVRSRRPGLLVPCPIRRHARPPERLVDLVHVLPDGEPRLLGRPAGLLAQNRSDDRGRFLRRSPAEELQADASREHILDGDRHVTGALDDFGANGRKALDDGLGEISVFLGDIQDHGRGGAKSARQVLRGLLGNTVIPDQAHPVDRCKTIRTGQGAISREARGHGKPRDLEGQCRLSVVSRILPYGPRGGINASMTPNRTAVETPNISIPATASSGPRSLQARDMTMSP